MLNPDHSQSAYWSVCGQQLQLDQPLIMGILNVTPDSFSDGGKFLDLEPALFQARQMLAAGADIIDIGGASSRPGAQEIPVQEELDRVLPVIEALHQNAVLISIDTQKAAVAAQALDHGAQIVNDVSAGGQGTEMWQVVAEKTAGYVMMHMQGKPQNMQQHPHYARVVQDIDKFFRERLALALASGIQLNQIVLDPGIGFGKTLTNNLDLIAHLDRFKHFGCPILLGASRKSFIGLLDESPVDQRLGGSLAAVVSAYTRGARLFRVHDVAATRQLLEVFTAIESHSD